jgi:hypothetical protein
MHVQRLAIAWIANLNTPPEKLHEQPEGATAMKIKKQEVLHYITQLIDLE